MASQTIHLFLNPAAGRGRARRRQARILEILCERGLNVELHTSTGVGSLEQLVNEAVSSGATQLVVAGGDGSVHEAVNGIFSANGSAHLGVIPSGTGNDFAKASEIPLDWEHATTLLAERLAVAQPPRLIDIGRCNDRYFANGVGIGFDAHVTQIARSIRLPIGDLVYLLAIFKAMLGKIATPSMTVRANDYYRDGPLTLANVSNGSWIGGMFHIAPMARNDDGQFELVMAMPVTRRRILTLLPQLMKGTHLLADDIEHQRVNFASIRCTDAVPSHLDGEVQSPQSQFDIEMLPAALGLL